MECSFGCWVILLACICQLLTIVVKAFGIEVYGYVLGVEGLSRVSADDVLEELLQRR